MNSLHTEEARIHAAYQRRTAADERYSWFDDGQLFRVQQFRTANIGSAPAPWFGAA